MIFIALGRAGCGKYVVQVSSEPIAKQAPNGIGWGTWRFSDSAIYAMGMSQAIYGLDIHQDAGGAAIAFVFVKLGLKTIGPSDAFAKTSLKYNKDAKRREFCRKIFQRRGEIKAGDGEWGIGSGEMGKIPPVKNPGLSIGADLCVCPESAQLPNWGRHMGLSLRCMAPKNLQKETISLSPFPIPHSLFPSLILAGCD
jgi:hypothetical protein